MQPPMNENQELQSLATLGVIPGPEEPAPPGIPEGAGQANRQNLPLTNLLR